MKRCCWRVVGSLVWLLPSLASGQEAQRLELYLETGHTEAVQSAVFSQDGKTLVSLAGTLKLWDATSGRELDTLKDLVPSALSPDGKTAVLVSPDNVSPNVIRSIVLWDVNSWRVGHSFVWNGDMSGRATFPPHGKTFVYSDYRKVTVWDIASGRELQTLEGEWSLGASNFSPDLSTLAWFAAPKITLLDTISGQLRHTINLDQGEGVPFSPFSPDGKTLVSASNTAVTLWDVASGTRLHTLKADYVSGSITFSPDSTIIAVRSLAGVRFWDTASGRELNGLKGVIDSLVFSPDGKTVAFGFGDWNDRRMGLWDIRAGQDVRALQDHAPPLLRFYFCPDGKTLAIGDYDFSFSSQRGAVLSNATLWDVASGQKLAVPGQLNGLAFSEDGNIAASWVKGSNIIKLWDPASWHETGQLTADFGISRLGFSVSGQLSAAGDEGATAWDAASRRRTYSLQTPIPNSSFPQIVRSPDSKTAAILAGEITLWDLTSSQPLHVLKSKAFSTTDYALSPDGKILVSCCTPSSLKLWDISSGQGPKSLKLAERTVGAANHHARNPNLSLMRSAPSFRFSPDGKTLAVLLPSDNTVTLWDVESGKGRTLGKISVTGTIEFSPDGKSIIGYDGAFAMLWDVASGILRHKFPGYQARGVVFSPDNKLIASVDPDNTISVWDTGSGWELRLSRGQVDAVTAMAFAPGKKMLASASADHAIKLWDLGSGQLIRPLVGHENSVDALAFSENAETIASISSDGSTRLWNVDTGRAFKTVQNGDEKSMAEVSSIVPRLPARNPFTSIAAYGRYQIRPGRNGRLDLLTADSSTTLASLVALENEEWVVTTPEGRFDTNKSLDQIEGLHWIVNDEMRKPVSLDVFMRQYYEPRLLPRVLNGEQFKPLPSIADINRLQPKVTIQGITPNSTGVGLADIKVAVQDNTDSVSVSAADPGRKQQFSSGVYDLRLFRDGQLVGYSTSDEKLQTTFRTYKNFDDELSEWREANKVDLVEGKKSFTFTVKLAQNSAARDVEFSAYAFNEDRVKSDTARASYAMPSRATTKAKPRAFVIAVGVNANENPAFDLQFAANDARRFQEVLPHRLAAMGEYSEVVPITLISDWEQRGGQKVTTKRDATKANFKAVLDLLAGRRVPDEIKRAIPNSDRLAKTTPDDMVLILFSSHGYADQSGNFYFIPYDTGPGACSAFTETVRQRSISSDEFSLWLRDVDAGQMTLIVDACYSTAAIEGSGFKPGPMGSRGLGQLAYDKRMRILTATQADNVAMELPATADGRPVNHGLLSYALLEDGLGANKADFKPQDKTIFLDEWLEYAVADVPKLFANQPRPLNETQPTSRKRTDRPRLVLLKRELADPGVCRYGPSAGPSRIQEQQPSLFDFTRRKREVPLVRSP